MSEGRLIESATDLARRARQDAEKARIAEAEYERTRPPSSIERQMAAEVGRLMGLELDPRSVRDLGYQTPYYVAELDVAGVTFVGHYLSHQGGIHRTSSPFTVYRYRSRWPFRPRREERQVDRVGDLDGWLGPGPSSSGDE